MRQHLLAFLIICVFFFKLQPYLSLNIKIWDEASYSLNAIELQDGFQNLLVNHRNGKPDSYSLKPPLAIYFQALSINFFGLNEVSLRLPNFLLAFLNTIILYFLSYRLSRQKLVGIISTIVFLTTNELFIQHGLFSANLDISLMFFSSTCQLLTLYFVHSELVKTRVNKYLIIFTLLFSLGFLSKGVAIFFIIPGCVLLYFSDFKNIKIISVKSILILSGIMLTPILYYLFADHYYPGYLQQVINSEILRSFDSKIAGRHNQPFLYYFKSIPQHFNYYVYFIPFFALPFNTYKNKKLLLYSMTLILAYFLTLSIFEFKAIWYLIPIVPVYSLFIGTLTADFFYFINDLFKSKSYYIGYLSLILFLIKPSINIFEKLDKMLLLYSDVNEKEGDFINYLYNNDKIKSDLLVLTELKYPNSSQLDFYIEKIHQNSHFKIEKISDFTSKSDSQIIICDTITLTELIDNYKFSIITKKEQCWLISNQF